MRNLKFNLVVLSILGLAPLLVVGCMTEEPKGVVPPTSTYQPTMVAAPPLDIPTPQMPVRQILPTENPTAVPANTEVPNTPPSKQDPATVNLGPVDAPPPTSTPVSTETPVAIAQLPKPAPIPAPDSIFDYVTVTAGRAHTCLLRNDGKTLCTGTVDAEIPFPSPSVGLESISSGLNHACGLDADGLVSCWGSNDRDPWYGQFAGQANPPNGAFTSVSAGAAHTCGIRFDGSVACWGLNDFGEADPPKGVFSSISAGGAHTCGVRTDDTLACWGNDEFGQASPPPGTFRSVSSGPLYSCGLQPDGDVVCWGIIWAGEEPGEDGRCFRICTYSELVTEEGEESPTVSFQQVHVGYAGSCGVTDDNAIRCWGLVNDSVSSPPEGDYIGVSVGVHHACGLRVDRAAVCWTMEPGEEVPGADSLLVCLAEAGGTTVCPGHHDFEMEAMEQSGRVIAWEVFTHNGTEYSCGQRLDDTLICWNDNRSAYLDPTPTSVGAFAAADADSACWLLTNQTVACWVHLTNWWESFSTPEGTFRSISLDETVYSVFGCGIRTDRTLSCWGDGDPDWGHLDPPPGEYIEVSTGYGHGCALRLDDTLVCWGNHNIDTPPEGTFRSIDGSGLMHCGVHSDLSVECWGRDSSSSDLTQFLDNPYQSVQWETSLCPICAVYA